MTVECGICHKYKNITYSTTEVFTQENTAVTHEAIKKYIHIYTSILSAYAIYTQPING
jgi:hypothetical protein